MILWIIFLNWAAANNLILINRIQLSIYLCINWFNYLLLIINFRISLLLKLLLLNLSNNRLHLYFFFWLDIIQIRYYWIFDFIILQVGNINEAALLIKLLNNYIAFFLFFINFNIYYFFRILNILFIKRLLYMLFWLLINLLIWLLNYLGNQYLIF